MIKVRFKEYPNGAWEDWSQYLVTPPVLTKKVESEKPGECGLITTDDGRIEFYYVPNNPVYMAFNRDLTSIQRYLFEVSCPNSLGQQRKLFEGMADFGTIEIPDFAGIISISLKDKLSALSVLVPEMGRTSGKLQPRVTSQLPSSTFIHFLPGVSADEWWIAAGHPDIYESLTEKIVNAGEVLLDPHQMIANPEGESKFLLVLKSDLAEHPNFPGILFNKIRALAPDIQREIIVVEFSEDNDTFWNKNYYGTDIGIYGYNGLESFHGIKLLHTIIKQQWPELDILNRTGMPEFNIPLEYFPQLIFDQPFNRPPLDAVKLIADTLFCYVYIDIRDFIVIQRKDALNNNGVTRAIGNTQKIDGNSKYIWDKIVDGVNITVNSWVKVNGEYVSGSSSLAKTKPGSAAPVTPRNTIQKEVLVSDPNVKTPEALNNYAAQIASDYMAFYGVRHSYKQIVLNLDDNILGRDGEWLSGWDILDNLSLDSGTHFWPKMEYDLEERTLSLELISVAGFDYYPGQMVVPYKDRSASASGGTSYSGSPSFISTVGDPYQWSGTPVGLNAALARQSLGLQDISNLGSGIVSTAEFNHLDGVTSNIQAQFAAQALSLTNHAGNTNNPHAVNKSQVGLGNVDNVRQEPFINAGTTLQFFRGDKTWASLTTDMVSEGAAKYYTDARARAAVSVTDPLSYNAAGGIFSLNISGNLKLTAGALDTIQGITPTSDPQFRDLQVRNLTVTGVIGASGTDINGTISNTFVIGSNTSTLQADIKLQFGSDNNRWIKWSQATETLVISRDFIVLGSSILTGNVTMQGTLAAVGGILTDGNISAVGTVSGSNIHDGNWDTAYNHSQAAHVGLTGANASGTWNINISGEADSAKNGLTTISQFGQNPASDVFGTWDNLVVRDDSHIHDGRYFTESEITSSYYDRSSIDAKFSAAGGLYEPKLPAAPAEDAANKMLNALKQWVYPNVNTMQGYDNLLTKYTNHQGMVYGYYNELMVFFNPLNLRGIGQLSRQLDTIQDIHTGASPTFAGLNIAGNILGPGGESKISGFKSLYGRPEDGILHIQAGTKGGVILLGYNYGYTVQIGSADNQIGLNIPYGAISIGEHEIKRQDAGWLSVNKSFVVYKELEVYDTSWLRGDINLINKARNNWLNFVSRDVSGSEALFNLNNIGSITSKGNINVNNLIKVTSDGVIIWGPSYEHGILSWDTGKAIIGARAGKDFEFQAGGSAKALLSAGGNFGLGTTSLTGKFTIYDTSGGHICLQGANSGAGIWAAGDLMGLGAWTTVTNRLNINLSTGNVGIGCEPVYTLDVNGPINTSAGYIRIQNYNNNPLNGAIFFGNNSTDYIYSADHYLYFRVNGADRLIVSPSGKIGINKYAASFALEVDGDIFTNSWVRTSGDTGWYNQTYGGGWYMSDSTQIRNYGGKALLMDANIIVGGGYIGLVHNSFSPGWTGSCFRLDHGISVSGKSTLEIDNIIVRGQMSVYELLIKQIRGTGGNQVITAATGKVASVSGNTITLENPDNSAACSFAVNDFIEAQVFNQAGGSVRLVQATVTAVNGFTLTLSYNTGTFLKGDNIYQVGNSVDRTRQAMFYFAVTDSNSPYMRIMDGINSFASRSDASKIKAQIGNLSGVTSTNFGALTGLAGAYLPVLIAEGTVKIAGELYASVGGFGNTVAQPVVKISTPGLYVQNYGGAVNVTGNGSYIGNWQSTTGFNGTILNHNGLYGYVNNAEVFRIGNTSQLAGFTFDNQKLSAASGSIAMDSNLKHFIVASNLSTDFVKLYFTNNGDWGIKGVQGNQVKFQLGYVNTIAGWTFDTEALFTGTKVVASGFAANNGDFTISRTIGLSTKNFYVDMNGNAGFKTTTAATGAAGIAISNGSLFAFDDHSSNSVFDSSTMNYGSLLIKREEYHAYTWQDQAKSVLDRTGLFISVFAFPNDVQRQTGYSYVGQSGHGVTEYTLNETKAAQMSPSAISISITPAGGSVTTATLTPTDLMIGTRSIMNSIVNLESAVSALETLVSGGATNEYVINGITLSVENGIVKIYDAL